jgi:opacity protein-like surface antigen
MKTKTFLMVSLVAVMTSAAAHADDKAKQEKFCAAIADFHSDFKMLDAIGPSSTLAELRAASDKVVTDAQEVRKAASKIKTSTSKEFGSAADKLRNDVRALPDTTTIDQARTKLDDDIHKVKDSAKKLTMESGCSDQTPPMKDEKSMDKDKDKDKSPPPAQP